MSLCDEKGRPGAFIFAVGEVSSGRRSQCYLIGEQVGLQRVESLKTGARKFTELLTLVHQITHKGLILILSNMWCAENREVSMRDK